MLQFPLLFSTKVRVSLALVQGQVSRDARTDICQTRPIAIVRPLKLLLGSLYYYGFGKPGQTVAWPVWPGVPVCSSRVFINPFYKVDILSFFFMSRQLETKASFLRPQGEEWVTNNLTGRHSRYHLPNKKWKNTIFAQKRHRICTVVLINQHDTTCFK